MEPPTSLEMDGQRNSKVSEDFKIGTEKLAGAMVDTYLAAKKHHSLTASRNPQAVGSTEQNLCNN